ncbi:TorF family putative porin [Ottowia thiooxydans]|uniref:TorF family putative porin n=1 Tax=Ottowia thiooxydans TaxID=219182 RepID=UPI000409139C|nr:TorF family putative porin [Ottowia thiooxydans]
MTTAFNKSHQLIAGMALLAAAMSASAQTATPPAESAPAAAAPASPLSFNVGLISDYRYRGISQSRLNPALSGGVDYAHSSGFYVGTWLSSIQWIKDAGGDTSAEWDVYGGYKGTAGPIGYDVGVLRYMYPSNKLGVSPNTTEIYGAVTWEMVTVKYSHSVTNLFGFDNSKNSGYLDVSAAFDLGNGWSLTPHVGRQWIKNNGAASYTDYSLTVGKDLGSGFTASAAIVGTDASKSLYATPSGRFTGRTGLVVGIKYTF